MQRLLEAPDSLGDRLGLALGPGSAQHVLEPGETRLEQTQRQQDGLVVVVGHGRARHTMQRA